MNLHYQNAYIYTFLLLIITWFCYPTCGTYLVYLPVLYLTKKNKSWRSDPQINNFIKFQCLLLCLVFSSAFYVFCFFFLEQSKNSKEILLFMSHQILVWNIHFILRDMVSINTGCLKITRKTQLYQLIHNRHLLLLMFMFNDSTYHPVSKCYGCASTLLTCCWHQNKAFRVPLFWHWGQE